MHAATGLKALAAAPGCAPARISEAIRLRLVAALLDLGNHLMLSADERKAFRLRGWLSSARARRLGVATAAVRVGARRLDEVNPGDPDRRAHAGGQPRACARPFLRRLRAARPRREQPAGESTHALLARRQRGLARAPRTLRHSGGSTAP